MFPDGVVTVAFPLSSTTTVAPGFTALTLSSMAFFSASVSFSGFATTVLSAGLTTSLPAFGLAGVALAGVLASDTLPAGSVAFAVTSPAGISFVGVIVTFPFSSATPSPILLPSLSNNSTLDPGSAVTSTGVLVPALSVKSVLMTGLAGDVVSLVTNSDNGFLSVEPSVYVTTRFPSASFVTDLILALASAASTVLPFLSAKLASSLLLEYSICSFSLIFSNSASVTLAGSVTATFSVGSLISYLSACDLTMNSTYPGLFRRSS